MRARSRTPPGARQSLRSIGEDLDYRALGIGTFHLSGRPHRADAEHRGLLVVARGDARSPG